MTIRASKPGFNLREKLKELTHSIGLKGSELMRAATAQDARDLISAGRKNYIINGQFDFWQRGTSFTGDEYTADRWRQSRSGGTSTVSRQPFTLGQTEVPGNPTYYLQQSCSIGDNNCGMDQPIEDVTTGAGGPVTVSFWAKGTNPPGYGYWAMQLWQRFGTGGSPSATVQNDKQLTITPDWKKYSFTYELASMSGKTLGTSNNSYLNLIIRQHASDSNTGAWELNIANVQVEFGKNATDFEYRSYGEELALCQRYFYKIGGTQNKIIGPAFSPATAEVALMVSHPVTMRTIPTDVDIVSTNNNNTDFFFRTINNTGLALTGNSRDGTTYSTEYMLNIWFNSMSGMPQVPGLLRVQTNRTAHIHVSAEL